MALSIDELKQITDQEIRQAIGGNLGGKLSESRRKAEYYYLGLPKGDLSPPEIDGRSTFVDTTVRNQIEWMIPQLMKTFCSGENVVEFTAAKAGDEQKAEQATNYINYLFYKKNNGYSVLQTAIRDALLQKAGILKVWWDNREEETREEYVRLNEMDLALLMDDDEIEPIENKAYPDEEDAEDRQKQIDQLSQALMQAQDPNQAAQIQQAIAQIQSAPSKMLYDVTFKRTKKAGRVRIEAVPPEEFLISRKAKSLLDATFVAHRVMRTISDLKAMGYKNLDSVQSDDNQATYQAERIERLSWDDDMPYLNQEAVNTDPSMRIVWVTECYIKVDYDGDGIAEWRKVVRAGNEILENEECDQPPFVALIPIILPHRFFGLSIADLGMESQRLQTQLVRAQLDNLFLQVNGRYFAVEGQVNLDDLLTSRPGGVVRTKSIGAVGRLDQGMGDISSAMSMLEWTQDYVENATGWTRRSQGVGASALQAQTATGMNLIANRDDMRLDLIARNFAEGGVTDLFRMMLKLVCQYQDKEEFINVNGSWVAMNPREWKNQFDLNINVGLGTNNKEQHVQQLTNLLAIQRDALQIGVATPANIYESAKELAKATGFKNGDKFFTDPAKNPQPQQPNPDELKLQSEQQKFQAQAQLDIQKTQAQMEFEREKLTMQSQIREHELALEAQKQQQQAQLDMQERQHQAQLNHELELQRMAFDEWKAKLDAETKILVAQISASSKETEGESSEGEGTQSALAAALQGFTAALGEMQRPKQIIRDATGRAQGIM